MKKLAIILSIMLLLVGCGYDDKPDKEEPIEVETEDYFLISWEYWELSEDTDLRYRLEGEVENISEDELLDAEVRAAFYIGEVLVDQMTYELGDLSPSEVKEFAVSTGGDLPSLTKGVILVHFEMEGKTNPYECEPLILNPQDFYIEEED